MRAEGGKAGNGRCSGRRTRRALRPERLYDVGMRLDVRRADEVETIWHGGEDTVDDQRAFAVAQAFQRFADGLRLPGQVDDQAAAAYDGGLATENRGRYEMPRDAAHLLAEARHLALAHRQCGFGRHVARRRPGTAGGDDEMAVLRVGQLDQCAFDQRALVRDQALFDDEGTRQRLAEPFDERRQALVLVRAGGGIRR